MKNIREAGGAVVIKDEKDEKEKDEKDESGLQGELACLQVTDLIFGLKIYRELFIIYR